MFQTLGKAWQVGKSILHSNDPINHIKGMIDREITNTWRADSLGLREAKRTGDAAAADSKALSVYNPQDSQLNREITNWDTGIAGSYMMFGD